jgi:hypothetical protein
LADLGIKVPEQVADMLIESILGGINTALGKTTEDNVPEYYRQLSEIQKRLSRI